MHELKDITIWLIDRRDIIVDAWLSNSVVSQYLSSHEINIEKFSTKFAHPILLHNLAVLDGTKPSGDCPIMNQIVNFMIQKNITSQEIFTICAKLRATVFEYLFKEYPNFFQNADEAIRIMELFDDNLSGVLSNFDVKSLEKNLHNQENIVFKKYAKRLQVVLDAQKNIILKIHDNKLFLANKALFLATGVKNSNEFNKKFSHPLNFIKTVSTFENLFRRKEYDEWLMQLIDKNEGRSNIEFFDHIINKKSVMQMSVSKVGELNDFIFTFENLVNVQYEIKKLNNISYKDSLTDLANLTKFKEMVEEKIASYPQDDLHILMIHLNGFKIFNDIHDDKSVEELIKNVADILKENNPDNSAKIDFERFAIICKEKNLEEAKNIVEKINLLLEENNYKDEIKPLAALVLHRKNDTIELMLARADLLLKHVKIDSLKTIVDETVIGEKEKIRLEQEKKFLQLMKIDFEEKKTVPVTNYYLEIGIKSDATILLITEDQLMIMVRKVALFSLYQGDPVYIQMPQKPNYKALVYKVDKLENYVTLHSFRAVDSSPLDRKHVHVKLEQPLEVSLSFESEKINAILQSISINTFEIVLQHIYTLQIGSEIEITAALSGKEDLFKGNILKIIPLVDRFIIVIHLEITSSTEEILSPYVSNRQLEIIKNLQKNILKM